MFKTGEFAKLSGLTVETLYHYEKMCLLKPYRVDKYTGYRYYEAGQLVMANQIRALKDAGLSLAEIAGILRRGTAVSELVVLLEKKAEEMEVRVNDELARLERLHSNIFIIKNGGIPIVNEVTIKSVEPILVASMRRVFKKEQFDEQLDDMWEGVNAHINKMKGKTTIPCLMIYHRGWTDLKTWQPTSGGEALEVEVVEPVTHEFAGTDEVNVYELPAVLKMASIVHKGPFDSIGETNEKLFRWIRQNGYETEGTMREIYHKGEWMTDNPEEYVTEVQIALR